MAKIGNEARLILKLAEEKAAKSAEEARIKCLDPNLSVEARSHWSGKQAGLEMYRRILADVVHELEAR